MSIPSNNPPAQSTPSPDGNTLAADDRRDALKVAHELANLIDGAMRNLSLATSKIQADQGAVPGAQSPNRGTIERLDIANQAMRQMAVLLQRWMSDSQSANGLHHDDQTFGQAVEQAVRLLTPAASARGVDIRVCLSSDAANLPAGPLYPIIANALRNSIEAFADHTAVFDAVPEQPQVDLIAQVRGGSMEMVVRDNGPGIDPAMCDDDGQFRFGQTTKPDHHGLGLELCREVAESVGGSLVIRDRQPRGAELLLRIAVPATVNHA